MYTYNIQLHDWNRIMLLHLPSIQRIAFCDFFSLSLYLSCPRSVSQSTYDRVIHVSPAAANAEDLQRSASYTVHNAHIVAGTTGYDLRFKHSKQTRLSTSNDEMEKREKKITPHWYPYKFIRISLHSFDGFEYVCALLNSTYRIWAYKDRWHEQCACTVH